MPLSIPIAATENDKVVAFPDNVEAEAQLEVLKREVKNGSDLNAQDNMVRSGAVG